MTDAERQLWNAVYSAARERLTSAPNVLEPNDVDDLARAEAYDAIRTPAASVAKALQADDEERLPLPRGGLTRAVDAAYRSPPEQVVSHEPTKPRGRPIVLSNIEWWDRVIGIDIGKPMPRELPPVEVAVESIAAVLDERGNVGLASALRGHPSEAATVRGIRDAVAVLASDCYRRGAASRGEEVKALADKMREAVAASVDRLIERVGAMPRAVVGVDLAAPGAIDSTGVFSQGAPVGADAVAKLRAAILAVTRDGPPDGPADAANGPAERAMDEVDRACERLSEILRLGCPENVEREFKAINGALAVFCDAWADETRDIRLAWEAFESASKPPSPADWRGHRDRLIRLSAEASGRAHADACGLVAAYLERAPICCPGDMRAPALSVSEGALWAEVADDAADRRWAEICEAAGVERRPEPPTPSSSKAPRFPPSFSRGPRRSR